MSRPSLCISASQSPSNPAGGSLISPKRFPVNAVRAGDASKFVNPSEFSPVSSNAEGPFMLKEGPRVLSDSVVQLPSCSSLFADADSTSGIEDDDFTSSELSEASAFSLSTGSGPGRALCSVLSSKVTRSAAMYAEFSLAYRFLSWSARAWYCALLLGVKAFHRLPITRATFSFKATRSLGPFLREVISRHSSSRIANWKKL
mmetsp:Transcript_13043/g.24978  ORF Transcript_13043/g.24978 Transcript_13043/m.24978 type:complete len:202 (-) Transcript_13043:423-1028(-)